MIEKNDRPNSQTALLLIDVINGFEFPDGDELFENFLPIAKNLAKLKKRLKKAGIPVIYVNDNYGKWQEDFQRSVENLLKPEIRGSKIVKLLKPEKDDYYVLKPKHSAFFKTVLELLLQKLEVKRLILTGVTTDLCILFTGIDAFMRDYELLIPNDCVAAVSHKINKSTLEYMKKNLDAEIISFQEIEI